MSLAIAQTKMLGLVVSYTYLDSLLLYNIV